MKTITEQSTSQQSTANPKKWKTKISTFITAFAVPFTFVGLPVGYNVGHHQYREIVVIHPGKFENYTGSDAVNSAWGTGLLFVLIGGVPAGIFGLGGYGSFLLWRKCSNKGN